MVKLLVKTRLYSQYIGFTGFSGSEGFSNVVLISQSDVRSLFTTDTFGSFDC